MDKDRISGAANKAKGAVKDAVGSATGDTKTQAEGKMDKAKGSAQSAAGRGGSVSRYSVSAPIGGFPAG